MHTRQLVNVKHMCRPRPSVVCACAISAWRENLYESALHFHNNCDKFDLLLKIIPDLYRYNNKFKAANL